MSVPQSLDPAAEYEWRRLRAQLDLAAGFWLGFAFLASSATSGVFEKRTEGILRERAQALHVILRRRVLDTWGETPQALRDLSVSLDRCGEVQRDSGDLAGALASFTEALELDRRRLATYGDTPQGLSDLAAAENQVADVAARLANQ